MEIKFEKVTLTSSASLKSIINNVSLSFKDNQITGIIGSSGSGKTALLELINALILPTSGKIKIGKFIISSDFKIDSIKGFKKNVGLVYKNPERQFSKHTVKEEIESVLMEYTSKVSLKRVIDSLKMAGLDEEYLMVNPSHLSKGEQKKVSLAIALSYNPKILLLDEPTLGLDDVSKYQLLRLLRMMKLRYNKTIIMVCNDTDFMHLVADYIYVLHNGSVALEGNKYKVFGNEAIVNNGIYPPKIIEFVNFVKAKKGINLGYRDDIEDLVKDIYRHSKYNN